MFSYVCSGNILQIFKVEKKLQRERKGRNRNANERARYILVMLFFSSNFLARFSIPGNWDSRCAFFKIAYFLPIARAHACMSIKIAFFLCINFKNQSSLSRNLSETLFCAPPTFCVCRLLSLQKYCHAINLQSILSTCGSLISSISCRKYRPLRWTRS